MRTVKVMFAQGCKKTKRAPAYLPIGYYDAYTVSEITEVPDELSIKELIELWDYCAKDIFGKHSYSYYQLLDWETTMKEEERVKEHNKGEWAR